jgi:two-component system, NtrC family, sensor histidine kinase HydH
LNIEDRQSSSVNGQSEGRFAFGWIDLLWLVFLAGLAALPLSPSEAEKEPVSHKGLILLCIGAFQLFEPLLLKSINPSRANVYSVLIKIGLATLLVAHTGSIFSNYWLVYFLPVVSAATLFGVLGTLAATALAAAAYWSFLIPALEEYEFTAETATQLAIRILFFFLAAIVVNRFMTKYRYQTERYRVLAETLAETNRQLALTQAEARRSERLAALGQLSAGLAHELRNPLGVIKGSAEMLARKLPSGDELAVELAGYISSEVNRLNNLVSRFLDFARPLALDRHPQSIAALVDRALKFVHDQWPEAGIKVEREYAGGLPEVSVDAELCEQVFTNLALNAYQAMRDQQRSLSVEAEPAAGAGGERPRAAGSQGKLRVSIKAAESDGRRGVEIDFADSGPGIPPELTEQIFNPFFTTKKDGVGLGLSIVSKIVDDHRGWIRVASPPGEGGCFRVFLPIDDHS